MKSHTLTITIAAFAVLAHAQEDPKAVFREAATHTELSRKLQIAEQQDPMKMMEKAEGADPSKANQPQNLIASSDIISFGGYTTLVPKYALVQIPRDMAERINNHTEGSKVVSWLDFYTLNRGWITTLEVSRIQAAGSEALSEATTERLKEDKNLVVATYQTGPISLQPLKVSKPEETPNLTDKP